MILAAIVKPGVQLIVCGTPSAEWLEWLRTTEVPLTDAQWEMKQTLTEAPTGDDHE